MTSRFVLVGLALVLLVVIVLGYLLTRPSPPAPTPATETPLTQTPTVQTTPATPPATQATPTREELLKPIIEAARREGKLVIYSTLDRPSAEPLLKRFNELYPFITVEYVELGTATLFSRFRSEVAAGAPTADILWSPAHDLQLILINEGHYQPYRVTFYESLPPEAKYRDIAYVTSYTLVAPIFSTEKIPRELWPKSFGDILNLLTTRKDLFPRNSICVFDPMRSGFGLAFLYYQHKLLEPLFTNTLNAIAGIGAQLHASTGPQIERVRLGECIISQSLIANYAFREAKTDPRIGAFIPEDFVLLLPRIIFITKQAQHPNAAKLFIEFVLSEEGQRALASSAEVTLIDNPYYPQLSLPYIKANVRHAIIAKLDDDIVKELLDTRRREEFLNYFKSILGIR